MQACVAEKRYCSTAHDKTVCRAAAIGKERGSALNRVNVRVSRPLCLLIWCFCYSARSVHWFNSRSNDNVDSSSVDKGGGIAATAIRILDSNTVRMSIARRLVRSVQRHSLSRPVDRRQDADYQTHSYNSIRYKTIH